MSKILYINNNNFHHLDRSQMCAGGCCYFRLSKPHSGTLWLVGAFNQEKALEGAFSVIVQPVVELMDRFAALVRTLLQQYVYVHGSTIGWDWWMYLILVSRNIFKA